MSDYDTDTWTDPRVGDLRDQGPEQHPWRHPLNIGHLVMGLAFLGLVAIWGLVASGVVADEDVRWLLPVPWVLAGGAGLVATALAARRGAAS